MLEAPRRALSIALVSAVVSAARGGGVSFNAHFVLRGRVVVPPPFSPAAILITLTPAVQSFEGLPLQGATVLTNGNGTFAVAVLRAVLAIGPASLVAGCSADAAQRCSVHGRARVGRVAHDRSSALIEVPPIVLYQHAMHATTVVDKVSRGVEGVAEPHLLGAHDERARAVAQRAAAAIAALSVLLLAPRWAWHTADAAGAEGSASAPLCLIDTESANGEVPASTMVLVYA